MDIRIESLPSAKRKEKPASAQPGFGKVFTDHMLVADWEVGRGWRDARIAPYGPFSLEPAAAVFHYGQEVFEGLKAFRQPDGRIGVFRLEDHLERFNRSAARVALPQVDRELFINGLAELLRLDRDWMPQAENTALYIRPMLFATEPALGVKPAGQCRFCIILSPAGAYCGKTGRLLVEQQMVRAAPGGVGEAKTGGNYAASLVAAQKAAARGFDQVLWLDAQHRNIEEAGAMNIFFATDQAIATPELSGAFLAGITRDSILRLAPTLGIEAQERQISIDEVIDGLRNDRIREIFATGTAAALWPVTALGVGSETFTVGDGAEGPETLRLRNALTGIQHGRAADAFGWLKIL